MGGNLYPELIRLLKNHGCTFVRSGKGSHEIWFSLVTKRNIVVPRNTNMARTANGILKDAGLPKALLDSPYPSRQGNLGESARDVG